MDGHGPLIAAVVQGHIALEERVLDASLRRTCKSTIRVYHPLSKATNLLETLAGDKTGDT
jgi:hypothetical protein